jgi:hypothetical protein
MKIGHVFSATAALALSATAASAATVEAINPPSVVSAMQAAGYQAKLVADKSGDPMIESGVAGKKFLIFFYNCTNNKDCRTIQFYTGFKPDKPVGLDRINDWNRHQRFGRAYIDGEGDPVIEMDVDLDDGGLSPALFTDNLEFWESAIAGFQKHIGL